MSRGHLRCLGEHSGERHTLPARPGWHSRCLGLATVARGYRLRNERAGLWANPARLFWIKDLLEDTMFSFFLLFHAFSCSKYVIVRYAVVLQQPCKRNHCYSFYLFIARGERAKKREAWVRKRPNAGQSLPVSLLSLLLTLHYHQPSINLLLMRNY